MPDLMKGGWLASRKRTVIIIVLAVPVVADYLTGEVGLTDAIIKLVTVISGF